MAVWESQILKTGLMGFFRNPEDEKTNFAILLWVSETEDGIPFDSPPSRVIRKLEKRLKGLKQKLQETVSA